MRRYLLLLSTELLLGSAELLFLALQLLQNAGEQLVILALQMNVLFCGR